MTSSSNPDSFSERFGHHPSDPPVEVREGAPDKLRYCVLQIASEDCGLAPSTLRDIVCRVLRERPNSNNWSEYPNIWDEVDQLVANCPWFKVYDIVEAIHATLRRTDPYVVASERKAAVFEREINRCYRELGIGWQLVGGIHEVRGDDSFEETLKASKEILDETALSTSSSELTEAIRDLSRRPEPDLSGAVHHAMAALEAVARLATGDHKAVLGEIIKRVPGLIPRPLDECLSKAWGYASENARHGREGRVLTYAEAQLVVGLSAVVCSYLAGKLGEAGGTDIRS